MSRVTNELRKRVWRLYYRGLPTGVISEIVGLSEFEVVRILGKK